MSNGMRSCAQGAGLLMSRLRPRPGQQATPEFLSRLRMQASLAGPGAGIRIVPGAAEFPLIVIPIFLERT